jgi:ribose 5-phosphate isomerase B
MTQVTDESRIRELVRRAVYRAVGKPLPSAPAGGERRLVTARDIASVPVGGTLTVAAGAIVTPLARQAAMERHVSVAEGGAPPRGAEPAPRPEIVALGADHGGFALKETLKSFVRELGHDVVDCGTHGTWAVDYPDFALAVAQLVADGRAWRGIVVDGAGIGSCMVANKVPGVRAAMCYDKATAVNSRAHNDANVLTLGAGMIGIDVGKEIVGIWLSTAGGEGRHARRVAKITDIEHRFLRPAAAGSAGHAP